MAKQEKKQARYGLQQLFITSIATTVVMAFAAVLRSEFMNERATATLLFDPVLFGVLLLGLNWAYLRKPLAFLMPVVVVLSLAMYVLPVVILKNPPEAFLLQVLFEQLPIFVGTWFLHKAYAFLAGETNYLSLILTLVWAQVMGFAFYHGIDPIKVETMYCGGLALSLSLAHVRSEKN